ncbi:hypothetical protein ACFQ1L_24040 [Phytohabitans flavus]|uniref:hypothetical protein n=1 Tax=Phytohabitans flavus TaxID=1076124 RepID=UPI0036444C7A
MTRRSPVTDILTHWSAITGVAGLAFYCVLRISYSVYFAHYGITPETVGLGFAEILAVSVAPANAVLLVVILALMLKEAVRTSRPAGSKKRYRTSSMRSTPAARPC